MISRHRCLAPKALKDFFTNHLAPWQRLPTELCHLQGQWPDRSNYERGNGFAWGPFWAQVPNWCILGKKEGFCAGKCSRPCQRLFDLLIIYPLLELNEAESSKLSLSMNAHTPNTAFWKKCLCTQYETLSLPNFGKKAQLRSPLGFRTPADGSKSEEDGEVPKSSSERRGLPGSRLLWKSEASFQAQKAELLRRSAVKTWVA